MDSSENLIRIICELLNQNSSLVLASIISQQGSSPRHIGAKMVIDAQGRIYGTIGGGSLEAKVIEESREVFSSGQSRLIDFDLTSQDVYSDRNICGGKATVLLDHVPAAQENLALFQSSCSKLELGQEFTFLTFFRGTSNAVTFLAHCLMDAEGKITGECPLPETDLENLIFTASNARATITMSVQDLHILVDPIRKTKTLYCFGAGHVARPTARLAAMVGFRVIVVDDRAEFANIERFPDAWDLKIIDDYAHALNNLEIDSDTYIIIFTRGHRFDFEVLEQAIQTSADYIGMIASRKKRETIYGALMLKGVTKETLSRVHSPIGLEIGAETPEEIAISIVAELIKYRSESAK